MDRPEARLLVGLITGGLEWTISEGAADVLMLWRLGSGRWDTALEVLAAFLDLGRRGDSIGSLGVMEELTIDLGCGFGLSGIGSVCRGDAWAYSFSSSCFWPSSFYYLPSSSVLRFIASVCLPILSACLPSWMAFWPISSVFLLILSALVETLVSCCRMS